MHCALSEGQNCLMTIELGCSPNPCHPLHIRIGVLPLFLLLLQTGGRWYSHQPLQGVQAALCLLNVPEVTLSNLKRKKQSCTLYTVHLVYSVQMRPYMLQISNFYFKIWISKTWRHHQTLLPRTKGIQDHTALFAPAKVRAQFSIDQSSSTWSSRCRTMLPMSIAIQPQEGFSAPSLH